MTQPSGPPTHLSSEAKSFYGWTEVTEITGQDPGSILKPLECVGSDGCRYFVKTLRTDLPPLICEWICGRLAALLGLPIPPIRLIWLPDELASAWRIQSYDLVGGWAFGSRAVDLVDAFPLSAKSMVDRELRERLLWFDFWINNADRWDGNPNLLWSAAEGKMWLIDHHLTLAPEPPRDLRDFHVFRRDWESAFSNARRFAFLEWLNFALESLPEVTKELPEAWVGPGARLLARLPKFLCRLDAHSVTGSESVPV